MTLLMNDPKVINLETLVEEATRATEKGVERFVEPAAGVLRRAESARMHLIFGRRGSGKSSLLRKACADLTLRRTPIAYIDIEPFKGHSYPDVLLSVLIETFKAFAEWLDTAAVHPASKTTFWRRLFGTKPQHPPLDKKGAKLLAGDLRAQINALTAELHREDLLQTRRRIAAEQEGETSAEKTLQLSAKHVKGAIGRTVASRDARSVQVETEYVDDKTQFLHRHIQTYRDLFKRLSTLAGGDSFLVLDDAYHLRRVDQPRVLDYFHRIAKGNSTWLKIGTIRHRASWYINGDPPLGLKIGDDADDIDLDLSLERFQTTREFLLKILDEFFTVTALTRPEVITDGALDRLVLASGGVARDFLGIFRRSIGKARERTDTRGDRINVEDINKAAGEYDTAKQDEFQFDVLEDRSDLQSEFEKIRDFCTKESRKNIFLLERDCDPGLRARIMELVDLRLIHRVDSRVTVSGKKSQVYEAYMLDVSQYTAERKIRDFEIIEFWKSDSRDKIRLLSIIYAPRGLDANGHPTKQ